MIDNWLLTLRQPRMSPRGFSCKQQNKQTNKQTHKQTRVQTKRINGEPQPSVRLWGENNHPHKSTQQGGKTLLATPWGTWWLNG